MERSISPNRIVIGKLAICAQLPFFFDSAGATSALFKNGEHAVVFPIFYILAFYDAGTYSISLADLVKVLPRKTRSFSAYEPLVKYLKEYHAITLNIVE